MVDKKLFLILLQIITFKREVKEEDKFDLHQKIK